VGLRALVSAPKRLEPRDDGYRIPSANWVSWIAAVWSLDAGGFAVPRTTARQLCARRSAATLWWRVVAILVVIGRRVAAISRDHRRLEPRNVGDRLRGSISGRQMTASTAALWSFRGCATSFNHGRTSRLAVATSTSAGFILVINGT